MPAPEGTAKLTLMCLVGGPIAIQWGLARLRQKRLIQNTPSSRIHSAAMGLVELSGTALQRQPLKAPITGLDACWWQCRVQEYRSSGKSRRWVTIKTVSSHTMLVLQDSTGQVLVNPEGAEIHAMSRTEPLSGSMRNQIHGLLSSWGVSAGTGFFGNSVRVIEEFIPHLAPLYVIGELTTISSHLNDRQQRFMALLKTVKADPAQMKEADSNRDGQVSAEEWDAFRLRQEEEFLKKEMAAAQGQPAESTIVKAPRDGGCFVVSVKSEQELLKKMAWQSPLAVLAGLVASLSGVFLALSDGWSPAAILGSVACGLVVGFSLGKTKGVKSWASLWW
jgi:hypothetical protein